MTQSTSGCLALVFEADPAGGNTHMHVSEQRPPLKVVRAFGMPDGAALVHIHNVSGGVLAGDRLEMRVRVGAGARAQITSTSATRVYRQRSPGIPRGGAALRNLVQVDQGGLLEYVPDPIIPYAHARMRQHTRIALEGDAGLIWWEVLSPGREAHGERFAYDTLTLQTDIRVDGLPIAIERLQLRPAAGPLQSPAQFGGYGHYAMLNVCRGGANIPALETQLGALAERLSRDGAVVWGASALVAHGVAVRGLAHNSRTLMTGLHAFWECAKRALYGRAALPPRKVT